LILRHRLAVLQRHQARRPPAISAATRPAYRGARKFLEPAGFRGPLRELMATVAADLVLAGAIVAVTVLSRGDPCD